MELWIYGLPLSEDGVLTIEQLTSIKKCQVLFVESRKSLRYLKEPAMEKKTIIYFLDTLERKPNELQRVLESVVTMAATNKDMNIGLFSDDGMPILFDPGLKIYQFARRHGWTIRTFPGPTSWSMAMVLSGWEPPFLLIGFLPQKKNERRKKLTEYKKIQDLSKSHLVCLDTPYRLITLLEDCLLIFGPHKEAFIAFDIGKKTEKYVPASLGDFPRTFTAHREKELLSTHQKKEFILCLKYQT